MSKEEAMARLRTNEALEEDLGIALAKISKQNENIDKLIYELSDNAKYFEIRGRLGSAKRCRKVIKEVMNHG